MYVMCFTNVNLFNNFVLYIDRFSISMYYISIDLGVTRITNVLYIDRSI